MKKNAEFHSIASNLIIVNQGEDRRLKPLMRYYFFSLKTCTKCYETGPLVHSSNIILPHITCHPTIHQISLVHSRSIIRAQVKYHSFLDQMSIVHVSNIIRPYVKYHSSTHSKLFIHSTKWNSSHFLVECKLIVDKDSNIFMKRLTVIMNK